MELIARPLKFGGPKLRRVAQAARDRSGRLAVNTPMLHLIEACYAGGPDDVRLGVEHYHDPLLDGLYADPVAVAVTADRSLVGPGHPDDQYRGIPPERAACILFS